MITVGRITKPQGVRGEVKVKPLTSDSSRFCVLKTVAVRGRTLKISGVRVADDAVYIKFEGIDDRNAAETLRGGFIEIDRAAAKPLEDGEFFIADLTGSRLFAGGKYAGDIASVQSFGAADVFTVNTPDGKSFSFPFIKALEAAYDGAGRLDVNGDILTQVAVYDED